MVSAPDLASSNTHDSVAQGQQYSKQFVVIFPSTGNIPARVNTSVLNIFFLIYKFLKALRRKIVLTLQSSLHGKA